MCEFESNESHDYNIGLEINGKTYRHDGIGVKEKSDAAFFTFITVKNRGASPMDWRVAEKVCGSMKRWSLLLVEAALKQLPDRACYVGISAILAGSTI